jgi:uncharacterized membrane protein YphA (DoxX/SURF4 family)
MNTTHNVIVAFLALIFVISGLSKASGNEIGLYGTREFNVKDGFARLKGVDEALAAIGLVTGLRFTWMQWVPLLALWVMMAGAIFFHFRANKPKTAFPAFFLLTLLSIAIVTI